MLSYSQDESIMEFNRLLEWINRNPETWNRVTMTLGDENTLNCETYVNIFQELKDNQFYQVIFMLFQATNNYNITEACENAIIYTLSKNMNKSGLDDFIETVINCYTKLKLKKG